MPGASPTRAAVALLALLVVATLVPAAPAASAGCGPREHVAGLGDACRRADGLFEVFSASGRSLGFTHGLDPAPSRDMPPAAVAARAPACAPPDEDAYAIRLIYARAHDDADDFDATLPGLLAAVDAANGALAAAAAEAGDRVDLRVVCEGGTVSVRHAVLPTPRAQADFSTIVDDLQAIGFTNARTKHWVLYDDPDACACAGTGHVYNDDRLTSANQNNGNAAPMFAVSFGSLDTRVLLHELAHTLGAAQLSAPHTTGAFHCTDGRDTMCYDDGGPFGHRYTTSRCAAEAFDCGRDDYFDTRPAAEAYLATHWNLGSTLNRYVAFGTPAIEALTCDASALTGRPAACTFRAADDGVALHYTVDWGDGATQRVPPAGTVAPSETVSAQHVYAAAGAFDVAVRATDDGAPPATSPSRVKAIAVAEDGTPVLVDASCPARAGAGVSFTCSLRATDDTPVAYVVDWGDGASTREPAEGHAPPGETRAVAHAYAAAGPYAILVRAVDDASPPHESAPLERAMDVLEDATPPTLVVQDPRAHGIYLGCGMRFDAPVPRPLLVDTACARAEAVDGETTVVAVRAYLDGALVAERTVAPFVLEFATGGARFGATLVVEAVDAAENVASAGFVVDTV